MRISLNSAVPIDYTEVGYGTAINGIYHALKNNRHQVELDSPSAQIQFNWMQPHLYKQNFNKVYNVLCFPWESTEFRTGWLDICNGQTVDEILTTSDWCKKIYEDIGVEKPVHVYPHGIDHVWTPKKRKPLQAQGSKRKRPLKFLIVDAEANRKGWQEAFDAFSAVFGTDSSQATLTIKTRQMCRVRWQDELGMNRSVSELPNVTVKVGKWTTREMVDLFHDHDVLIYPSWGEGWGLIPFQFLATGGIAIATKEWCHYRDYLGDFGLDSTYEQSPWRGEHEGLMCKPDKKHLEELVRKSHEEFDEQVKKAFKRSFQLHEEYDWDQITGPLFMRLLDASNAKFDRL